MFSELNKEYRTHKLPFPVYGKGVGDGSIFKTSKIIGYRPYLCVGKKTQAGTRRTASPREAYAEATETAAKAFRPSFAKNKNKNNYAITHIFKEIIQKGLTYASECDIIVRYVGV